MIALSLLLALVALPFAFACAYLLLLTLTSLKRLTPPPASEAAKFEIVVPAHNESAGIGRTVQSLLALDYPRDRFRVVVVADNCSDDTADRAREAGATVRVRQNAELRGKGYALEYAFSQLLAEGWADAAVVVDADTTTSPDLLRAFAARLAAGAGAAQADYAVQNPTASWRTRLMTIALGMFHILRSRGREALGVSCGLRGNGMCFAARLLREVPHQAFSIVEDLEYGVRLGQAGHRVVYAHEAHVYGEMVSGEKASRSQRRRWEGGRRQIAKQVGWPLLREALARRSGLLLDLSLDVLVPPLSTVAVGCGLGLLAATALAALGAPLAALPGGLLGLACASLSAYVVRGWTLSGTGARGLLDLLLAPFYIVWKLGLALSRPEQKKGEWVRTAREGDPR